MASLFRQIIENNPPIVTLYMNSFSFLNYQLVENIGELILEPLLSSNIDSITELSLARNFSWFKHPDSEQERAGLDLLAELISKQAGLQYIDLSENWFTSNATQKVLTRIAEHHSTYNKL